MSLATACTVQPLLGLSAKRPGLFFVGISSGALSSANRYRSVTINYFVVNDSATAIARHAVVNSSISTRIGSCPPHTAVEGSHIAHIPLDNVYM